MDTFPRVSRSTRGYEVAEVERFLARARRSYDGAPDQEALTAEEIRQVAFGMKRGGYAPSAVDAALERLEDAFAGRERLASRAHQGDPAWYGRARTEAVEILARLDRPDGERFSSTGRLVRGYRRADVDRFAARLQRFFRDGDDLSVGEVRRAVFRAERHGYREDQVDLLLDAVTDVMLAVR